MTERFECGDSTTLVGFLYGECDPGQRDAIDAHLSACAACAAELAALQSTRAQLAAWTPAVPELGFRIVGPQAAAPAPQPADAPALRSGPWYRQPLPAWAQLAAATVIFAAGLVAGLAGGTPAVAPQPLAQAAASQPASGNPDTAAAGARLAALEERLRTEMAALRAPEAAEAPPPAISEAALLASVRALIEESEDRQQRELALRTAQIMRDFDLQRRIDLAHIQRTFGQIEGLTGAEVREQRQMLDYLIRVSQQR